MIARAAALRPSSPLLYLLRTQLRYELQLKYVGSVAGVYWALVNPIVQVGSYVLIVTVIFEARLAVTSAGRFDYAIYVLAGMSVWLAMQEGLVSSSTSLIRHADIVKNVVFPLELLPASAVLISLVSLGVSLTTLIVLVLASGDVFGVSLIVYPLVLAIQLALTLGIGFGVAILTVFLRDLTFILPVLLQVLTLLTPIVYALEDAPGPLQMVSKVNPVYYLVDSYRQIFFYGDWPNWGGLAYVAVLSAALFLGGLALFRRAKGYAEALV